MLLEVNTSSLKLLGLIPISSLSTTSYYSGSLSTWKSMWLIHKCVFLFASHSTQFTGKSFFFVFINMVISITFTVLFQNSLKQLNNKDPDNSFSLFLLLLLLLLFVMCPIVPMKRRYFCQLLLTRWILSLFSWLDQELTVLTSFTLFQSLVI